MDPITPYALAALLSGAYMQYQASSDAQERQNAAIRESLSRQRDLQMQAEQKAVGAAQDFAPADRKVAQTQIADQITKDLITPVSESQAIRSQQSTTQGNVSGDYTTAKAQSELNSVKAAQQLAALLGKTTASNRLRMGEDINLMNTGQSIDQLNNFSRGQNAADQIAIQVAGRPDASKMFMGSLLQTAGGAGAAMGGTGGVTSADITAANMSPDPIATLNTNKGWTGDTNNFASAFKNIFK